MKAYWYVVPLLLLMLLFSIGCSSTPIEPTGSSGNDDWDDWPADFWAEYGSLRSADGDADPIPGPDPIPIYPNLIAWTRVLPPCDNSQWNMPNSEIGVMFPTGLKKWRFTYWQGMDDHASWGKLALTWQSDRGPHNSLTDISLDIFKRSLYFNNIQRLTFNLDNFHPDWDKGRITWVHDTPDPSSGFNANRIFHMNANGTDWQGPFGLNFPTKYTDPIWTPDGQWILFSALTPSNAGNMMRWDIYRMKADGSMVQNLTGHLPPSNDMSMLTIFTEPAISRDGNKLAFASNFQGNWDIYYIHRNAYSLAPIKLTHSWAVDRHPTWSPNGEWIAFSSNRYDWNFEIYKMKLPSPDGIVCSPKRLTWSPFPDINPDWSPAFIHQIPWDPDPIP